MRYFTTTRWPHLKIVAKKTHTNHHERHTVYTCSSRPFSLYMCPSRTQYWRYCPYYPFMHTGEVILYQCIHIYPLHQSPVMWLHSIQYTNPVFHTEGRGALGFPIPNLDFPPQTDWLYRILCISFPPQWHQVLHLLITKLVILYETARITWPGQPL